MMMSTETKYRAPEVSIAKRGFSRKPQVLNQKEQSEEFKDRTVTILKLVASKMEYRT